MKAYEKPQLKVIGNLSDLTMGGDPTGPEIDFWDNTTAGTQGIFDEGIDVATGTLGQNPFSSTGSNQAIGTFTPNQSEGNTYLPH